MKGKISAYVRSREGITLIDLLLSLGILSLLFGGMFLVFSAIVDSTVGLDIRAAGVTLLNERIEFIRNLTYDDVGTVGGVPSGVIPQSETVFSGDTPFIVRTTIRNIDDPFDGTLGGSPSDTAPADYKLVEVSVQCAQCERPNPISITTTVAPKNLESATSDGSIFITVLDALGQPVSGASVRVTNASITPTIDVSDTTNAQGMLQLVGVGTSTQRYAIQVSSTGYSVDQTYLPGEASNPSPVKPHATVAAQTVTNISFAIDRVSRLYVSSTNPICGAVSGASFSVSSTKLIGTGPDVLKFATSGITDSNGSASILNLEWDTYDFSVSRAGYDLLGVWPFEPIFISPSSTIGMRFAFQTADPLSLHVLVTSAAGGGAVLNASATLSRSGFSETRMAGWADVLHTDWSGGAYISQSGGVDTESVPGKMTMAQVEPGRYSTTTQEWIESQTFDIGTSSGTFEQISFVPSSQPQLAQFQVASNNDQTTWNYVGPDGTGATYYTADGSSLAAHHANKRYLRYKVFLSTSDESFTPEIREVTISYSSPCVPDSQMLFTALSSDTYILTVSAPGFFTSTSSVNVSNNWQQEIVSLTPQ